MKKQLLITFDYELYLGNRSGIVEECMIEPTNRILEVLKKHSVSSIFFVDTTYLIRLKELSAVNEKCRTDFEKIALQLNKLIRNGHYVFPHIHPHWLDASYDNQLNQWQLNNTKKYRFYCISDSEKEYLFTESVSILKIILKKEFPEYQINGFRAGGWCIQPFQAYKPFFEKHKILYEFSVLGGFYQFTEAQHFDFSDAPEKPIYRFSNDVCKEDPVGNFTEFNISSLKISPYLNFINKIWTKLLVRLLNDHTFLKGQGQQSVNKDGSTPKKSVGIELGNPEYERLAIELMTAVKLPLYLRFIKDETYMHLISHPKMITRHNLKVFDKFLEKVLEKYSVETDFHNMITE